MSNEIEEKCIEEAFGFIDRGMHLIGSKKWSSEDHIKTVTNYNFMCTTNTFDELRTQLGRRFSFKSVGDKEYVIHYILRKDDHSSALTVDFKVYNDENYFNNYVSKINNYMLYINHVFGFDFLDKKENRIKAHTSFFNLIKEFQK